MRFDIAKGIARIIFKFILILFIQVNRKIDYDNFKYISSKRIIENNTAIVVFFDLLICVLYFLYPSIFLYLKLFRLKDTRFLVKLK